MKVNYKEYKEYKVVKKQRHICYQHILGKFMKGIRINI